MNVVFGTVKLLNAARGFGFVRLENGTEVHFWLDRGFIPAVGWAAHPMAVRERGRALAEKVPAAAPHPGERLALEYRIPEPPRSRRGQPPARSKGPTASWWAPADEWLAAATEIESRASQYPVGLYYWPMVRGTGLAVQTSYQYPGQDVSEPVHYDYNRVPPRWAVVRQAGELPHQPFTRGMCPTDWDTFLPPGDLEKYQIVRGRDEYLAALRAELAEMEAEIGSPALSGKKKARPKLSVDRVGNGTLHYMGVSLKVEKFQITRGRQGAFSTTFDPDDSEFALHQVYLELGGRELGTLPGPVARLAEAAARLGNIQQNWTALVASLGASNRNSLQYCRTQAASLRAEIVRREAEGTG